MDDCKCALNRKLWKEEQDPGRYGWLLTTCPSCGRFIGRRPKPSKDEKKFRGVKAEYVDES